jgi:endonuclease/exonuclease/phosphatase family metal-dependent hydrolase
MIVLSPGLVGTVRDSGHVGSRIVWVELETATGRSLVIIVTHIPHFGRSTPSADDVYEELTELMGPSGPLPQNAVKVVMGDFNGRLARAYDYTGRKRVVRSDEDVQTEVFSEMLLRLAIHVDVTSWMVPRAAGSLLKIPGTR